VDWHSLAFGAAVVALPVAASDPGIARRLVYPPAAPWMAVATASLAFLGLVLTTVANIVEPRFAIAFCAPLLQLGLVHAAFRTFVRLCGRDPIDAAFNWRSGLGADRAYALLVTLGGILPFIATL